jgi:hypothetical protein
MFLAHNTQFAFILANSYALIVSRRKKMWLTKGGGVTRTPEMKSEEQN